MQLGGIQKLTLLDYPGHTAATVFTPGCNLRCPYCYNVDLVRGIQSDDKKTRVFPSYPLDEFFSFLKRRKGLLDGICITGGEPLLQEGMGDFCRRIKDEGFAVKLDTNGTFPEKLKQLVEDQVIDYVAVDIKNAPADYAQTVGVKDFDHKSIDETISYLSSAKVESEFRTTVIREFHTLDKLRTIARWIRGPHPYYLQNFDEDAKVLVGNQVLHGWTDNDLRMAVKELRLINPKTYLRGIEE
ncbi:MAG: anaerobic ribonucleoside-triphosphate reductase activating protein [Eggerthellaceae bacterium]|jgi:pyruvate formate lyase activating enzyme